VAIAGVISIGLALCAGIAGGGANGPVAFVLFLISLPWTVPVFVLTMFLNVTSPVAIAITLVIVTLLAWRYIGRLLLRTCVSPRER
jgi:hypothetical protein